MAALPVRKKGAPSKALQRRALVRALNRPEIDPNDVDAVAAAYEEEIRDLQGWKPVLNRAERRARIHAITRRRGR